MSDLSEHIVKEIETRGAIPKPRWHFLVTRGMFSLLAVLSVIIGGVAFAVASFVFFDNDGASMALLVRSSIFDIAQSIPFIWLCILGLLTASAYFGFRHTRTGYRYATAGVVLGAIAASIALGFALNTVDFGQNVHQYLLQHTSFYDPLIHSRDDVSD
jgi:tryptophan-rich sensory protein